MNNIKTINITLIILIITVLVISCGKQNRNNPTTVNTLSTNSIKLSDNDNRELPTEFKPFPAMPEGNVPLSLVRQVSDVDYQITGKDYIFSKGSLNTIDPTDNTAFAIVSDNNNKLAYAQYSVGFLTTARPVKFDVSVAKYKPADETEYLPLNYYIGIANFTRYVWEWFGPYTDEDPTEFSITLNSETLRDRYVDKLGLLHFVVITSVKDSKELSEKGRVGLSFKSSITTISPSYLPNKPHYVPIKRIYTGTKKLSSFSLLSNLEEADLNQNTFNQNPLENIRQTSALTPEQYITIEWNHIAAFNAMDKQNEAVLYQVFRKGRSDKNFVLIGTVNAPTSVYRDPLNNFEKLPPIPEPIPGEEYQYTVNAVTIHDLSCPQCNPAPAIPQILAPTGVSATIGKSDEIVLSWNAVLGALQYEIWASYTANDPKISLLATIPAPGAGVSPVTYSDKTAELGKIRYYKVKAIGFNSTSTYGVSDFSEEAFGVLGEILFPPTDVEASDGTSTQFITVTWKAPTAGSTPEGYSIWRSITENGEYTKVGEVGNVLTFDDPAPTNDTYWYKVKSTKTGVADSEFSPKADSGVKKQPVMPPINLAVSKGDFEDKITLQWEPPTTGLVPTNYLVYRSLKHDVDYTQIANVTSTNYEDTSIKDGNTYWYKIKAQNGADISGFSVEDFGFLMQLQPPLSLTASDNKYLDRIRVDWLAPNKGAVPEGYIIYRSSKPDADFVEIAKVSHPTLFYEDLTVPNGFVYYYKAVSYKTTFANSSDSNVDGGYVTQLTPPTNVKASDGDYANKIVVTWSHASLQKPDGYNIYRASSEFGVYTKVGSVGYVTSFEDFSVPNGYIQWYKVVSVKKDFPDSLFSEVNDGYLAQLTAPTNLTASDGNYNDKVRITWNHSTGVTPDGYDVYRANSQLGTYTKIASVGYVNTYDDTSLTTLGTFWYKVKATKANYPDSTFSNADSGNLAPLNPPTNVNASDNTYSTKIVISWNHPAGQIPEGYDIYRYSYQTATYVKIGSTGYATSYEDTSMPEPNVYWYKVKSTHSKFGESDFSDSDSGSNLVKSDWWMFGLDATHNRRSANIGPATNTLKWSYTTSNLVRSAAAIAADGTIYIGSSDNNLYALNPNGTLKWSYNVGVVNYSSPAIDDEGTVYIGTLKLYAIKPDGKLKWSYTPGGSLNYCSPTIAPDGTIYIGSNNGNLYAVNSDGTLKWSYPTGGEIRSSVALSQNGTIYFGSYDKKLYSLTPSGSLNWTYTTGDQIWSSPAIGPDGTIYIGSNDKKLYAISPSGSLIWSYDTGGWVTSSPAINADGTIFVGSWDNKFYAINPNGSLKWSYKTGSIVHSSPAIGADGLIYVGSQDRSFYAFNPNGTVKFTYTLTGYILASPAIGIDGTVFFGCDDYKFYAIGPGNGSSGLYPPSNVTASDLTFSDKVRITWTAPAQGPVPEGYYVYRATSSANNAIWQYIGYTATQLFDDTTAVPKVTYYYKVKSYKYSSNYNDSPFSYFDAGTRN